MVQKVYPTKWESISSGGGENDDSLTELNANEDHIVSRGLVYQNDTSNDEVVRTYRNSSNQMMFQDSENSPLALSTLVAGGGITEPQHEALDTTTHDLSEDHYFDYTYSGNKVTNITAWATSSMTTKVREWQYTYSGNKVQTETVIQYDGAGVEKYRLTATYSYSGNKVSNVDVVKT